MQKGGSSSSNAAILPTGNNAINKNAEQRQPQPQPQPLCVVREQDQYMPIANVIRIMRRILPAHAKISDDAKETIQECVSEYISFVTGEANERCQREQRKTITAEDVLWAMGKLGFDDYVEPLTLFLNRYRESESDRPSLRGEPFSKRVVDYGPAGMQVAGPFPAIYPMPHHQQGLLDAAAAAAAAAAAMGGGYYRDGSAPGVGGSSSSSSSQNAMANYDPFAPFK